MAKFSIVTPMWSEIIQALVDKIIEIPEGEDITLYQNTPGGSVFAGWALIGVMKDHGGSLTIKAFGDSSSMGFYDLLYADIVEALSVTKFTIHRADAWTDTEDEKNRLKSINKDLREAMESKIDEAKFTKMTGKTFDEIFDPEKRIEVTLTAKQLKKLGVVNKIIQLNDTEIKAVSKQFAAYTDFFDESQGSGETQGSEEKKPEANSNNNNNLKNPKKMDREQFKAENLTAHNEILAEGRALEQDRVKSFMAYNKIAPERVAKAISEGEEMKDSFRSEMHALSFAPEYLAKMQANAAPETDSKAKPEEKAAKTEKEIKAEKEDKELREGLGLPTKEEK